MIRQNTSKLIIGVIMFNRQVLKINGVINIAWENNRNAVTFV